MLSRSAQATRFAAPPSSTSHSSAGVTLIFKALANRPQFIVYRRADKVPVHHEKLWNIDAQDPANWLREDIARAWASAHGPAYGVGIVLWKGCGVACIDIDKAHANGEWSPLANELCARFQGAYIEVSQSGNGLHIFFSYRNEIPAHKKKNTALHIEFYDELRFIGLTGTLAQGDPTTDFTDAIPKLIADYFVPGVEVSADGWTVEPAAAWDGPADDEELIRRALASRSAGALFGSRASFRDLWENNIDALARAFPPQSAGKDYDGSSADQALANHLAFWAGGNCERMHGLMLQSGLVRAKWEREDYLRGTIAKAAAWQKTYYKQREITADVPPSVEQSAPPLVATLEYSGAPLPANEAPKPAPPITGFGNIINDQGQPIVFGGCVYIQDINQIMVPSGFTLKREQFDNSGAYKGREYVIARDGAMTKSAWECFTQSKLIDFPGVRGTYFDPRDAEGLIKDSDGLPYINTWRDPKILAVEGDASLYFEHIKKIFPNGDDALIYVSYIAACVQHMGHKSSWALFIQGVPGNGKSFLTKVITYCFGKEYVASPGATQLDSNFNGYLYRRLMICVEEIMMTEGKAGTWEKLKTMITEPHQQIETKGVDQVTREVCFNMIFNSNHKDGLRKTGDDRRICPLYCAQQTLDDLTRDGLDTEYFIRLWTWFNNGGNANILHALRTFEIPEQYDFTKRAIRAPRTTATDEAINAGLGSVEQDVLEAISAGRPGFRGGWINAGTLNSLLNEPPGRGKFLARNKRREMLSTLGYEPHPKLLDGRLNVALQDGTKPTLYIKRNNPAAGIEDQKLIKHLYETAQKA
jgi:Family of unknown function (DUF5906)